MPRSGARQSASEGRFPRVIATTRWPRIRAAEKNLIGPLSHVGISTPRAHIDQGWRLLRRAARSPFPKGRVTTVRPRPFASGRAFYGRLGFVFGHREHLHL